VSPNAPNLGGRGRVPAPDAALAKAGVWESVFVMAAPSISLTDLLKRAFSVGATEVKLIPGRKMIVVLPQGESEVKSEPLTGERVEELMAQVITPLARRSLASGSADWDFELEGRGPAHASAVVRGGQPYFSVSLVSRSPAPRHPVAREPHPREPAAREPPPPTRESRAPGSDKGSRRRRSGPPETGVRAHPAKTAAKDATEGGATAEIDRLLAIMLERRASDLHISSGSSPLLRLDGEMAPISGEHELSPDAAEALLMPIVPPRNREEFKGTHDTDFAYELPGRARFRVNLFVDLHGIGAVFRVIPAKILTTDDLGLPKELLTLCALPKGLVLVTGPTGSGKSTTLAALIDYINRTRSAHVITIEDPIEFVHANKKCLINQRQVGEHTDSFKRALRAALREDPDIVLLGEMRDLETVSIAIETAETGHLVFGTLHTSSAPSTIDRIIDQYPADQQNQIRVMLSSSLKAVICQMLCKKTGGGRVAALEVMFSVPAVANLIREQKIFQIPSIMQTGRKLGMRLMNDSLLLLAKDGIVSAEEALSKSYDRATLTTLLQQNNIPIPALPA
jgi:twitching motility protein PilT